MLNAVAVPVMFVPTRAVGVPSAGVTSVGEVANTKAPVPVSSVTAAASCAEVAVNRLFVRLIVLFVSVWTVSAPTNVMLASGTVSTRVAPAVIPLASNLNLRVLSALSSTTRFVSVMVSDGSTLTASNAVPDELTVTSLLALPDRVGSLSKPVEIEASSARMEDEVAGAPVAGNAPPL